MNKRIVFTGGGSAGHAARAAELGHITGEKLVMHFVAVIQYPLDYLFQ